MQALIVDGQVAVFPLDLRKAYPRTSWPRDLQDASLPEGVVHVVDAPMPLAQFADLEEGKVTLVDGHWTRTWTLTPWTPDRVRSHLKDRVTQKRWDVETGGITLANGARVDTTIEDQNRIASTVAIGATMSVTGIDFKGADGWITLELPALTAIANAIGHHVQQCFSAERAHHAAIDQLDYEALLAYDVDTGWPSYD